MGPWSEATFIGEWISASQLWCCRGCCFWLLRGYEGYSLLRTAGRIWGLLFTHCLGMRMCVIGVHVPLGIFSFLCSGSLYVLCSFLFRYCLSFDLQLLNKSLVSSNFFRFYGNPPYIMNIWYEWSIFFGSSIDIIPTKLKWPLVLHNLFIQTWSSMVTSHPPSFLFKL
jgi:hypothetical protein